MVNSAEECKGADYRKYHSKNDWAKIIGTHKFWDQQPVSSPWFKHKEGQIEKQNKQVSDDYTNLPEGYWWTVFDVSKDFEV